MAMPLAVMARDMTAMVRSAKDIIVWWCCLSS